MRIGLDYRLVNRHFGGMSVYLKNLVSKLKIIDKHNKYVLFDDNPSGEKGFVKNVWTIVWDQIWLQIYLPYFFWKKKIDLAYFPNPSISFFLLIPVVLTIPDVSFMYDNNFSWITKLYLWIIYFLSAHKANSITTFSTNSKKDIINFFKVGSSKIYVTPLSASKNLQNLHKSKKNYFLSVPGTLIPRKNLEDTLFAFKFLLENMKINYQLKIVGHTQNENFNKLVKLSESLGIKKKVIFLGRVSDHELSLLYSQAKIFICTSLYEGFGLPILEAMKCGTPVISYSNSSLTEIVGDAGILVDTPAQLAKSISNLLVNKSQYLRFVSKGRLHAKQFSWTKSATTFISVINRYVK